MRFYGLSNKEILQTKVPEVLCAIKNINRIRAEEAEMDFYVIGSAMSGDTKILESLKLMRLTEKERQKELQKRKEMDEANIELAFRGF